MTAWPVIEEPLLLERFAMDDEAFLAFAGAYAAQAPARDYTPELHARAIGYPWERPTCSYVLEGDAVTELAGLTAAARAAVLERYAGPAARRLPLLAIGSNGAPATLRLKFAHFPDPGDRAVLVCTGHLHDHDVGASASPTAYGALPATIFASPGTRVRTALLWLTPAQFVQLAWSELSYHLGRLTARFEGDEPGTDAGQVLVFVSRFGTFAPDGEPLALAAVPARGRTAVALTQHELLGRVASLAFGPGAGAERLLGAIFADALAALRDHGAQIRAAGVPFASDAFERFPLRSAKRP